MRLTTLTSTAIVFALSTGASAQRLNEQCQALFDEITADVPTNVDQCMPAVPTYQLVDMSGITGFEKDHVQFMKMQAEKAERLANSGLQSLVVYIAPTAISQDLSAMFVRSWIDVDAVVPLVQHSEAEALALLGQPEKTLDMLLATLAK